MDKKLWHYNILMGFYNIVYGKTINESDVRANGKIFQSPVFYRINGEGDVEEFYPKDREDTFYVQLIKDNQQYLLPKRYIKDLPIMVKKDNEGKRSVIDVKIKKADKDFWKYILGVESYNIPKKKIKPFRWYIDNFNPQEHTNPKAWTFMKLLAHSKGLKMAICTNPGFGKQSNFSLLRFMRGKINSKLLPCTKAVFWRKLKFYDHINIDEITSWKAAEMSLIEDDIGTLTDDSPEHDKHSLDPNGQLSNADIRDKGLTFTFNQLDKHNPNTFDSVFTNFIKIKDRVPIIYLQGNVTSKLVKPSKAKSEALAMQHFNKYKNWCMMASYYYDDEAIMKELHNYDYSKSPFQTTRFFSNTHTLLLRIDAYCDTQAEFDEWMLWIKDRMDDYDKMRRNDVVEEFKMKEEMV